MMKKFILISILAPLFSLNAQTVLWEKVFSDNYQSATSQEINSNGELFFGGGAKDIYTSTAYGSSDVYVQKNNTEGNALWKIFLGGNRYDTLADLLPDEDGGVTVVTKSNSNGGLFNNHYGPETVNIPGGSTPNYDIYLSKLTDTGNLWNKIIGGSGLESDAKIIKYNSGFLLAVTTDSKDYDFEHSDSSKKDVWIINFSGSGDIIWKTRLLGSQDESFSTLKILNGEITVLVNSKSSDGIFRSDNSNNIMMGYVIVLDSFGNITKNLSVTDYPTFSFNSNDENYVKDVTYFEGKYAVIAREPTSPSTQSYQDIFTSAYNQDGSLAWKRKLPFKTGFTKSAISITYQNDEIFSMSNTFTGGSNLNVCVYSKNGSVIKETELVHGISDFILFPNNSLSIAHYEIGNFSTRPYYFGLYLFSNQHQLLANKDIKLQVQSDGKFLITKINNNEIYGSFIEFALNNSSIPPKLHLYKISFDGLLLSTNDLQNAQEIKIYPNPAFKFVRLTQKADEVAIFSADGKLINTLKNRDKIEVVNLPTGIYYLKANFKGTFKTFRFIKN